MPFFSIILHSQCLDGGRRGQDLISSPNIPTGMEPPQASTAVRAGHGNSLILVQNHPREMPGKAAPPLQGQQIIGVSTTLPKSPLGFSMDLPGLSQHRDFEREMQKQRAHPGVGSLLSLIKQSLGHILKHKNLQLFVHLSSYTPQSLKRSDKPHNYQLWVSITLGGEEHHGQSFHDTQELTHNWSLTWNDLFSPEWKHSRAGRSTEGMGEAPAPPFLFPSGEKNPTVAFDCSLGFKVIVTSP